MLDEMFMNKYRIASARAQWHDYNGGEYFVTICTHGREHYFGEISGGQMNLSEIGNYANAVIQKIPTHNHYAEIPLYVIMPNHIHLIVIIDGGNGVTVPWRENCRDVPWRKKCRDVPWRVSTDGTTPTLSPIRPRPANGRRTGCGIRGEIKIVETCKVVKMVEPCRVAKIIETCHGASLRTGK